MFTSPWSVLPSALYAFQDQLIKDVKSQRPETDAFGDPMPKMKFVGDYAIIPIHGMLMSGADQYDKRFFGATDYADIQADLKSADSSGVSHIILDINSPGGMVVGLEETSNAIIALQQSGIEITAYTSQLMCSAAYHLAAGASRIYGAPSSIVGSIGTILQVVNFADALKAMGIEVVTFTSGPYKSIGSPTEHLTPKQGTWLQDHVTMLADEFKAHVTSRRMVRDEDMQGQFFTGKQAAQNGLLDGTANSLDELLAANKPSANPKK